MIDSIADINVSGWMNSFADDTKVCNPIDSIVDAEILQHDLEKLYNWQENSRMEFNAGKFEVLNYGISLISEEYEYMVPSSDGPIESKPTVKDLGIIMNDQGDFDDHIRKICTKVKKAMGWIRQSFCLRNRDFLCFMWKTFCQPDLDYGSQLWSPCGSPNLMNLEGLLRTFTTWFHGMDNLSYWDRLSSLKISSIERRFQRYKIIYTWKIVEGLVPNCGISWNTKSTTGRLCHSKTYTGRTN